MNTEENANQIENKLKEWSKSKERLIVGIEGYSGVGKTTFLGHLTKCNIDILPIHMDDFVFAAAKKKDAEKYIREHPRKLLLEWNDGLKLDLLRNLIKEYKKGEKDIFKAEIFDSLANAYSKNSSFDLSAKILVVEGVFLFHPNVLDDLLDKRIYLDSDLDSADKRRVKREKERWKEKYFPDDLPNSFFGGFALNYRKYINLDNPKDKADWVIKI